MTDRVVRGEPIEARPATVDDAPAIAAIHVRSWQRAYADLLPADFLAGLDVEQRVAYWRRDLAAR